jgi:hypothetical protein
MGLDSIIKNNPNWDNNINSVYINNNIYRTMKEINKALEEDFKNEEKNNKTLKEYIQKNNKNYIKNDYKEKQKKKEEAKKNKKKINNNNYFDLVHKIIFSIIQLKKNFRKKVFKKLKIC